jgi:nicotinate dehydrogenase subunit B
MTGFMHEKEFSRAAFVKAGGVLIVGFSVGSVVGKARAASVPVLPSSLVIAGSNNPAPWAPDPNAVDSWIAIHADNTVSLMTCKCEVGGGQMTSLSSILAEELGMNMGQVKFVTATTKGQVNAGSTGGSSTTTKVGRFVRAAGATAYQALLGLASAKLGVPATSLTVSNGVVSGGGRSVSYGELIGDQRFNIQMPASYGMTPAAIAARQTVGLANGQAPAKPVSQYTIVGTSVPRIDIPAKVGGTYTYIHNVKVPGMLHGRVVLPRGQTAYGVNVPVLSVDKGSIAHIAGVQVVQRNNFIGVVAPIEYDAIQAAAQLKVKWADTPAALPTTGNLFKQMRAQDSAGQASASYVRNIGDVNAALATAAKVISQTYSWQYQFRGMIGPSCAIADVTGDSALIFSNSKNPHDTLNTVAAALGLPPTSVEVRFYEGSSDYGWAIYNDAVEAAAVLSQAVGKPVRVQFMRWDEHGYDNYGPAQLMDIRAGVDSQANLVGFDATTLGLSYYFYGPGDTVMQALGTQLPTTLHPSSPSPGAPNPSHYRVPAVRGLAKAMPIINSGYPKTSYLRSPRSVGNAFALEQMIDELAHAAGMDPVAFRKQNISPTNTDRLVAVLDAVTQAAKWQPRVAASNLSDAKVVTGRGVSLQTSSSGTAAIAEIEVNKKTGKIVPKQLYVAMDTGLAVNPDGVKNQIIGASVQATSWTLIEQVAYDAKRVTSLDWVTYPILRFKDAPKVNAIVISRPDQPATGAGEEAQPAVAGALANAFFDATGVRLREAPMTPGRVRGVLKAAGVV